MNRYVQLFFEKMDLEFLGRQSNGTSLFKRPSASSKHTNTL